MLLLNQSSCLYKQISSRSVGTSGASACKQLQGLCVELLPLAKRWSPKHTDVPEHILCRCRWGTVAAPPRVLAKPDLSSHHRVSAGERTGCKFSFWFKGKKNKKKLWLVCMPSNQSQSSWVKINPGCNDGAPAKRCGVVCTWRGEEMSRQVNGNTHTLKTVSSEAVSLMNNSEQINWIKTQLVEPCCTKCVWAGSMGLTIYSARLLKQTEEGGRGERRRRWAALKIWSLNSPKSPKYFSKCFTNLDRKYIIHLLCTAITNDAETKQPNCLHLQTASVQTS